MSTFQHAFMKCQATLLRSHQTGNTRPTSGKFQNSTQSRLWTKDCKLLFFKITSLPVTQVVREKEKIILAIN